MPFNVPIEQAQREYQEYTFITPLTPSEQKAAFHVRDEQGQDLCLKIISPDYDIDRLDREIEALQSISHPNVVRLIEYTRSSKPGQQKHYIVEEFVDGVDLGDKLQTAQQWTTLEAAMFFTALFDGLTALKSLNIVHRDLKPSNVRVRTDGSPVIIDFGLARLLDHSDLTRTSEGAAIGTRKYFSPEQCVGTKYDIDHRTDLFAAGILLYQALTGSHPFWQADMPVDQFQDVICHSNACLERPEFISLPNSWRIIVGRLLSKERAMRPHNAAQVAQILRRIEEI